MVTQKEKQTRNLFVGGLILFILALFGSQIFSIQSTPSEIQRQSGGFISVPTYGFFECQKSDNQVRVPSTDWEFVGNGDAITCAGFTGDSLPQTCDVVIQLPFEDELPSRIIGSDRAKDIQFLYEVCSINGECGVGVSPNVEIIRRNFDNKEATLGKIIRLTLSDDQQVYVEYQEGSSTLLGESFETFDKVRVRVEYNPFFVRRFDVFSAATGETIGQSDCRVTGEPKELNFVIESIRGDGKLEQQLRQTDELDLVSIRGREARITYLSNFVAIVPQYQLFDDDTKYCVDKRIYQVEEIETPSGIYKVANTQTNSQIDTVECCTSADVPPGFACEGFKRIALSEAEKECSTLNPCPVVGFQPIIGKKVVSQECREGQCVTVTDSVSCNFNEECPGGLCDVDPLEPKNNKCVGFTPADYCGNGVCEGSFSENVETCPSDCRINVTGIDPTLILIGVGFAAVIGLILFMRARSNQLNF